MSFWELYLLFWTFSIIGWMLEVIVFIIIDKKLINRGFFVGPYCPIYGFGAILMLSLNSFKDHPITCFILALVLCSALEYFASYILEKLFKVRWWDYSNYKYQLNGRICLINALAFGALGVLFTRYLNPLYFNIIRSIPSNSVTIIGIVVMIFTLIDIVFTFNALNSIKNIVSKNISNFKNRDATVDVRNLIKKKFSRENFLTKRIIQTHDLIIKGKEKVKNEIKKAKPKNKKGYFVLSIFIVSGVIIGIILSIIFKEISATIMIPIATMIAILLAFLIIMRMGDGNV